MDIMQTLHTIIGLNLILEFFILLQYSGIIFFTIRSDMNGIKPFLILVFIGQLVYHAYHTFALLALFLLPEVFMTNQTAIDLFMLAMVAALFISAAKLFINTSLHTKLLREARKINGNYGSTK